MTKLPKKFQYSHRRKENPHGDHDEWNFAPEHDYPVRCFECNRLMDSGFLAVEMQCPNCNYEFSKQEARDASVESQVVNEAYTGWDRKILDRFEDTSGTDEPVHIDKDLDPVTGHKQDSKLDVARNMTAWANEVKRTAENPARAWAKHMARMEEQAKAAQMHEQLKQVSEVDDIIHRNPFTEDSP